MRAQLDRYHLDVADVFVQTGAEPQINAANDPDVSVREQNRETFLAMIRYAKALGASHMTGLPGVLHDGVDVGEDWKLAIDESMWRLEKCKEADITYAIEAHVGSILPDPQKTLRFLEAVPGLTLTLDYGHFIYQGMSNEESHCLIPYASHFHARGGANGALQTTVKENTIDFPEILKRLEAAGYEGYLCLEYVWVDWEGCNRTDNVSETILLKQMLEAINQTD